MTVFVSYERRHKEARWAKKPQYRDRINCGQISTTRLKMLAGDL
jgi:hypothetical protein